MVCLDLVDGLSHSERTSYAELAFSNICVLLLAAILEKTLITKVELRETIVYDRVDQIRPEKHAELIAEIQARTGISPSRLELGKINYLSDTVVIDVFYHPNEQEVGGA